MSETTPDVQCFCYMVRCADGCFYTGWSTDPTKRTLAHNLGKGAAYTKMRRPVELVYIEKTHSRSAALRREAEIKKNSHQTKRSLAEQWLQKNKETLGKY